MSNDNILEALKTVENDAKDAHQEQLRRIREMGEWMNRGEDDVIEEFEKAIAEYEDGRRRLAETIAQAAAKIGRRRAPAADSVAKSPIARRRPLPHEEQPNTQ